jgi:hypothetical protein
MESMRLSRLAWIVGIIVVVAAVRVALVNVPNVAPISGLALFAAAHFKSRTWGLLAPLIALFLGDAFMTLFLPEYGFYDAMPFTYAGFLSVALIGLVLRRKVTTPGVLLASVAGSSIFFIISNFGVWATGGYPITWNGLILCYEMAWPFYRLTFLGDLAFAIVFFGGYALVRWRKPAVA